VEKEQLKIQLEQTSRDLNQKRKELKSTMSKYTSEFAELQNVEQDAEEEAKISTDVIRKH
jgi:hypothetical protein